MTEEPESVDEKSNYLAKKVELQVFTAIVNALSQLDERGRSKMFKTVATFFEFDWSERLNTSHLRPAFSGPVGPELFGVVQPTTGPTFSENRAPSAKQFIFEKKPSTEVERVACLAYYLSHYRETSHFKTFDLSKLNTEAAQVKFSNPARAVDHATRSGFLVPAGTGKKQISSAGELFVQALPDRLAAKQVLQAARPKRTRTKTKSQRGGTESVGGKQS